MSQVMQPRGSRPIHTLPFQKLRSFNSTMMGAIEQMNILNAMLPTPNQLWLMNEALTAAMEAYSDFASELQDLRDGMQALLDEQYTPHYSDKDNEDA